MLRAFSHLLMLPAIAVLIAALVSAATWFVALSVVYHVLSPVDFRFSLPNRPVPSDTVWLCRPGMANNPCTTDLTATAVAADGSTTAEPAKPATKAPIDCFYVYPTVSKEKGLNSDLRIDAEEKAIALAEAARFSQVCNVYAPVYPQLTKSAINHPDSIDLMAALKAYEGVWRAYLDYMAHYNNGRGVVFIGHSQGAFLLTILLQGEVDSEPEVRSQLVSALLLGGNVTVPIGATVGGDFAHIPACQTARQNGCVIAYSTFASTPPADALFGRVDSPISPFAAQSNHSRQVLCVNPALLDGGKGELRPYLPTSGLETLVGAARTPDLNARTPFVTYPDEFTAECRYNGTASWLDVRRQDASGDTRPDLSGFETPRWGLHMVDVSVALGNLVDIVRTESDAYTGH